MINISENNGRFVASSHRRLLGKLSAYGKQGNILNWIKYFLCGAGRSQVVNVNGEQSAPASVISGIPQVAVLDPLLFVIYINDILYNIKSEGLLFADDMKIFHSILTRDITTLEEWSKRWLLRFNPDKCHVLSMGRFENIRYSHR